MIAVGCLAAVVAGAVVTIGFRHDVGTAGTYRELFAVMMRWHPRLIFWSRVSWTAVAIGAVLLSARFVVRLRRPGGLPAGRRPTAAVAAALLGVWVVHVGLAWPARAGPGELAMVAGDTAVDDRVRAATLAAGPLLPAYGWFGLAVVLAFAGVTAVLVVPDRRGP